jgi:uncharacterized membrane protein YphA (DoxX/SURF4 family)
VLANRWLQLLLRLVLGGFFLYASLDKIANPAAFAKIVYQWQVVGPVASNLVAVLLPWVEALAGALLIAGLWRRESALVVAVLLVVFLGAAASVLAARRELGCSSAGPARGLFEACTRSSATSHAGCRRSHRGPARLATRHHRREPLPSVGERHHHRGASVRLPIQQRADGAFTSFWLHRVDETAA